VKKSIHMAAAITLALASSAHAKCPARLSGTYSGYATLDSANSGDSSEIHGKRVKVMTLRSDGTGHVDKYFRVDGSDPVGLKEMPPTDISFSFDKETCTLRIWKTSVGTSAADLGFAVANGGSILYGIGQSPAATPGQFLPDTNLYVFTRQ